MASEIDHPQLHVFFFPFMAHGHMTPMIDIARLFAARGVKATIITTPFNASLFSNTINRDKFSGHDITIQIIRFPSAEAGLPEGCESLHSLGTANLTSPNFFKALGMLQQPMERLLQEHHPDCIVADMFFPWVTDIAAKFHIPRLVFQGSSFFTLCAMTRAAYGTIISSQSEDIVVLDLPDKIEMKRSLIPDEKFLKYFEPMMEAESRSYGVLVNSLYELESAYAEHYRKVLGRKAWHIGPVSIISNRNTIDKAQRGEKSNLDESYFLNWLDGKKPNTVLYVCFGSLHRFSSASLLEIALALKASGFPFIWVIRTSKKVKEEEEEKRLPEGFEERLEGQGLIINDWAPQMLILDHPAIGGFMTHCGWNSILEGLSAGVPLITWPLFGDQFYNEKLVTQALRVGIEVGVEKWSPWTELVDASVKKERIEKAVNQLMGNGEEAREIRKRAKVIGQKAKKAVEEGGSSYADFTALIEELRGCKCKQQQQPSYAA